MERLADPHLPDDEYVKLLESPIHILYNSPIPSERNGAQNLLTNLQGLPNAWMRVDKVLDYPNSSSHAKFFALQILEKLIQYRWKTLSRPTCESIRNYVVNKLIKLSETESSLNRERIFVSKLNLILVQIVKQEWPHQWGSFVSEIVGASRSSVSLCENNMKILRLLSEEVFEFSSGQMTQDKISQLKNQFNDDFSRVFELCQSVFMSQPDGQNSSLFNATLRTLNKFLTWIPLGYILETELIEKLVGFIGVPKYRNAALPCLVEIASLQAPPKYSERFVLLYVSFIKELVSVLPLETDIAIAYEDADDETQTFVMDLALFFTGFFRNHISLLDVEGPPQVQEALRVGHQYLVRISQVSDIEVFKTCLEWWFRLASELYDSVCVSPPNTTRQALIAVGSSGNEPCTTLGDRLTDGNSTENRRLPPSSTVVMRSPSLSSRSVITPKRAFFGSILADVRHVMISRMAKPEEVLIVEDENGEIVRETTKDTDAIALYKTMKETLVLLTHLDTRITEGIMLAKLSLQIDNSEWSWNNLNTLCWAIGSISGAMGEEEERKFLVTVIKDLLQLVEMKRGKDNKAVVASNIMYVVGQYPRFLRAHWKFLKTVVNKLFEFMHETHPGVQDMACDTFLKIAKKCRRQFVTQQTGESKAFIVEMLESVPDIIRKLEPHQIQSFYEACGCIAASETDPSTREQVIRKLFELPNGSWQQLLYAASISEDVLLQRDKVKSFLSILKTNARVASVLGSAYLVQLEFIFNDMLKLYKAYSGLIQNLVGSNGHYSSKSVDARNMRAVKREVLRVIETSISVAEDKNREQLQTGVIDPLTDAVLSDYYTSRPETRESAVLSLYSTIICYLKGNLQVAVLRVIFKSLVGCTLDMIKNNFQDFPDARINFFVLLRAINQHNFSCLFQLDENPASAEAEFRIIINAIVWAFKHTERNVAETGLQILLDMLRNVDYSPFVNYFYKTYFKTILNDILSVLTDTFHRPGFKLHAQILKHLVTSSSSGRITEPLWDQRSAAEVELATDFGKESPSNWIYLRNHLLSILKQAFPNLSDGQVDAIVMKLLSGCDDKAFKGHLRDFLVQTKEFSSGDNSDLYDDEKNMHVSEKEKQDKTPLESEVTLNPKPTPT